MSLVRRFESGQGDGSAGGGTMNPTIVAIQAGVRRGGIEFRQTLRTPGPLNYIFLPAIFLVVMYFLRGKSVPGTGFSLSAATIPSVFGMQIVFAGLIMVATILFMEREDGTLPGQRRRPTGWWATSSADLPDHGYVAGFAGDRLDPRRAPFWRAEAWQPWGLVHLDLVLVPRPGGDDANRRRTWFSVLQPEQSSSLCR